MEVRVRVMWVGLWRGGVDICRRMKAILVIIQLIVVIHQSFLEIKIVSLIISSFIALIRIDIELVHLKISFFIPELALSKVL